MSEYLSDEERLAQLRGWWERYGTLVVVGVLLVAAAIVGWRWYQSHVEARTLAASDLYAEFQEAEGDARSALAERIIAEGSGTAYPAFVLLDRADAAVAGGDAAAAEAPLRRAVELASGPELADLARLRLARVLFATDRGDEAMSELEVIRGAGYLSLAAELKGDIHLYRGERGAAHEAYVTARSHVQPGDQRPLLEMKIADTAASSDS